MPGLLITLCSSYYTAAAPLTVNWLENNTQIKLASETHYAGETIIKDELLCLNTSHPNTISVCASPQSLDLHNYYHTENDDESPYICSQPRENGMRQCSELPLLHEESVLCRLDMGAYNSTDNTSCVNWNQYYTNCSAGDVNPFKGAINFDNIGYAWIAIFQVSMYWLL